MPSLDFVVIGAAKAGTTALFNLLRSHPQLHLPEGKELPYFVVPKHAYYDSAAEFYADAFRDRGEGQLCGTVTPQYLYGALLGPQARELAPAGTSEKEIPRRIREAYPKAKLIAVLRDPVARARSHHRMSKMRGFESRSFDQAVEELLEPGALEESRRLPSETNGYVVLGEYGRLLQGYYDVFPREQLLVLFHEELERDPAAACERVFAFLGVDAGFRPGDLGRRHNPGGSRRRFASLDPTAWQSAARRSAILRRLWQKAPRSLRRRILNRFNLLSRRLYLWNRVPLDVQADTDGAGEETLARLSAHFAADGEHLRKLLGVAPPWEVSTHDASRN